MESCLGGGWVGAGADVSAPSRYHPARSPPLRPVPAVRSASVGGDPPAALGLEQAVVVPQDPGGVLREAAPGLRARLERLSPTRFRAARRPHRRRAKGGRSGSRTRAMTQCRPGPSSPGASSRTATPSGPTAPTFQGGAAMGGRGPRIRRSPVLPLTRVPGLARGLRPRPGSTTRSRASGSPAASRAPRSAAGPCAPGLRGRDPPATSGWARAPERSGRWDPRTCGWRGRRPSRQTAQKPLAVPHDAGLARPPRPVASPVRAGEGADTGGGRLDPVAPGKALVARVGGDVRGRGEGAVPVPGSVGRTPGLQGEPRPTHRPISRETATASATADHGGPARPAADLALANHRQHEPVVLVHLLEPGRRPAPRARPPPRPRVRGCVPRGPSRTRDRGNRSPRPPGEVHPLHVDVGEVGGEGGLARQPLRYGPAQVVERALVDVARPESVAHDHQVQAVGRGTGPNLVVDARSAVGAMRAFAILPSAVSGNRSASSAYSSRPFW